MCWRWYDPIESFGVLIIVVVGGITLLNYAITSDISVLGCIVVILCFLVVAANRLLPE